MLVGALTQMDKKPVAAQDDAVEVLRGLSILLLVLFHSVGASEAGVAPLRWLAAAIDPFIMPAFAFMAGYVFALRPVTLDGLPRVIRSKVMRILLPLFSAVTITLILRAAVSRPLSPSGYLHAYFFSFEYFWFLQAIFVVFVLVACLDAAGLLSTLGRWSATVLVAWLVCGLAPGSEFFSLWGVNYLLPIFLVAHGASRFRGAVLEASAARAFWWAALAVSLLLYSLARLDVAPVLDAARTGPVAMVLGTAASALFLTLRIQGLGWLKPFVVLGALSYCIYLYHGIGLSFAVKDWEVAGLPMGGYGLFLAKVAAALLFPILFYLLIDRSTLLRKLLLGKG